MHRGHVNEYTHYKKSRFFKGVAQGKGQRRPLVERQWTESDSFTHTHTNSYSKTYSHKYTLYLYETGISIGAATSGVPKSITWEELVANFGSLADSTTKLCIQMQVNVLYKVFLSPLYLSQFHKSNDLFLKNKCKCKCKC